MAAVVVFWIVLLVRVSGRHEEKPKGWNERPTIRLCRRCGESYCKLGSDYDKHTDCHPTETL